MTKKELADRILQAIGYVRKKSDSELTKREMLSVLWHINLLGDLEKKGKKHGRTD